MDLFRKKEIILRAGTNIGAGVFVLTGVVAFGI